MTPRNANCSFCRKDYRDVGPLVEGHGDVYICGECVELCQAIIAQEKRRRTRGAGGVPAAPTLDAVRATLDRISTGSSHWSDAPIQAALDHYEHGGRGPRNVILLFAGTRSSRLYAARALAHALDAPFAEADTTHTGEPPLSLMVFDKLLRACNYDMEFAKHGIVYTDDADDPATQERIMDLSEQVVRDPIDHRLMIDLARLLFICGGTFAACRADTGITKLGRHPNSGATAEALGIMPALALRIGAVMSVPLLDEATLTGLVRFIDFAELAGSDDSDDQR